MLPFSPAIHQVTGPTFSSSEAHVDLLACLDPMWEDGEANPTRTHLLLPFGGEVRFLEVP